jgi:CheY-like chemotaxis protein
MGFGRPPRSQIRGAGFDVSLIEVEPMDKAMTRTRLVLVEDDQDSLEAFSIFLGEKYAVFGYASAAEAVQVIDATKPDVLVLDIGMYPVDGVQCLEMIRATPGYRDIPAVALTGFARDVERQRFLDGGFQAVVVKPVLDHWELIAVIDRLVNSSAPAAPRSSTHPRRSSPLPTPSADAARLDGRAAMTASAPGGSGETHEHEPA